VARAWVATTLSSTVAKIVAVVIARIVPHVLVGFAEIRNEDIINAIAVEVAHGGAV
jgi:hypothetical protein